MPHWAQRARLRARRDHEFRSQGRTGPRFQTHSQRSIYPEAVKPELPLTDPATLQEEFHRSLSGFPEEIGHGGECAHAAEAARWPRPVASGMPQMPPGACCASAGESRWGRARPTKRAGRKEDRAGPTSPGQHRPRPAQALGLSRYSTWALPSSSFPSALLSAAPRTSPDTATALAALPQPFPACARPAWPLPHPHALRLLPPQQAAHGMPGLPHASGSSHRQSLFILQDSSQKSPPPGSRPSTPPTYPAHRGHTSLLWVLSHLMLITITSVI